MKNMQISKIAKLGWVVAAALAGIMLGSGFQDSSTKIGVVDISKVVEESNFGKQNATTFQTMRTQREGLLEFIDTHRVLTNEQAQRLRDLSLKGNPSADEKAEMDRIKAEVLTSDKRAKELSVKQNLTAEERDQLQEYSRRSQTMNETAQRWYREFSNEMQRWIDEQKLASLDRARAAVQDVARQQGYSVVFEVGIAPYGANDLTDATLKAMNARK
jgi:Skp family chaperone for outer membrane proteins